MEAVDYKKLEVFTRVTRDPTDWSDKQSISVDASRNDVPEVHGKFECQTRGCMCSTYSETSLQLMQEIHEINMKYDQQIQVKIHKITEEENLVVQEIIQKRKKLDEDLLEKAKSEQEEQDKMWNGLLQQFIDALQNKKLECLKNLQNKLDAQRKKMMEKSQETINKVGQQARQTKQQTVAVVQQQAETEVDELLTKIRGDETTSCQVFGEELTKVQMTFWSKFGTKTEQMRCENISQVDLNEFKDAKPITHRINPPRSRKR